MAPHCKPSTSGPRSPPNANASASASHTGGPKVHGLAQPELAPHDIGRMQPWQPWLPARPSRLGWLAPGQPKRRVDQYGKLYEPFVMLRLAGRPPALGGLGLPGIRTRDGE